MANARLEKLEKQKQALEERIKAIHSKERGRERKQETRKKILLGSLLQKWMGDDESIKARVDVELPEFLTRNVDRKVFGLEPVAEKSGEDG